MAECRVGRIKLGSQGLEVSAQGLGRMSLSAFFGVPEPKTDPISLLHHAINSGITFLDTADSYGPHTDELLLAKALKNGVRERVELASKFGIIYGEGKRVIKGDPLYVRAACEASLQRLDVDCIDLYYQLSSCKSYFMLWFYTIVKMKWKSQFRDHEGVSLIE
ncbi:unnamed protein product [Eruca vesicaria subsp. sativa]|uniref:NADP-dependent oxidoreductase domain-containing protein n=1 Tax=Eruca vesicaria subsp. sativa TaxID=29727 RepID=A0ABC8JVL8_ERUVS|nr:unnamed protein product [Eruca vesicaria subsp. sativa]